jgi:hypothetical protein
MHHSTIYHTTARETVPPPSAANFKNLRTITALWEIFAATIFPWIIMVDSAAVIVAGVVVADAAMQGSWFMLQFCCRDENEAYI